MIGYPNCKINLGLHVVRRRADGYHDLETLFAPLPLCDELEIVPSDKFSFVQEGLALEDDGKENLVIRAYKLMRREYPDQVGAVSIRLKKVIPCGAGLGGGSSDVAYTLIIINELFHLKLDQGRLMELAATLGADCAFFILNEASYATGIGDQITPLGFNPLDGYHLLLVKPDETVSTSEAYRGIVPRDRWTERPEIHLPEAVRRAVLEWRELICNDFEASVFKSHPKLEELKHRLYSCGALYASMTGSGSALYGLFLQEPPKGCFNDCQTYLF